MATFSIQTPDGAEYEVDAPDENAALSALGMGGETSPALPSQKQRNPAEYDASSPEYQAKYGAAAVPFGDNFVAGVGKSFVDLGRGAKQLVGLGDQAAIDESAQRDAPLMRTGAGLTGYIGGQAATFAVPGGAIGGLARGATLPSRLLQGAALGGAMANLQPVTSDQSRGVNTAIGAAGGVAGELLATGIGALARGGSQRVSPEVAALAQKADELGIPLRAEQVNQSRPLAGVSAALDSIPFSGRDASREVQRKAFNTAIARTIGENTDNVASAVQQAEKNLGGAYDAVLSRYPVRVDEAMASGMDDVLQAARSELSDQQFGVIQRQVDTLLSKIQAGDQIDAQAAYSIKKTLDRIGRGSDSSVAYHARELKDVLLSGLDRSLPADVAESFAQTRSQYANLITIRKLVKAGADGGITPARLGNANTRGALRDVANVGAQFLKEPFGNSGTANRIAPLAFLGGAGTIGGPVGIAKAALAGITVGRGTNALLQSPRFVGYQLNGSNALLGVAPYTNALLPSLGAAGAISSQ